jgi:hypothetical protein
MTQPFPLGATVGDGRLVLVECIAGGPEQGIYLAADRPRSASSAQPPGSYLVSTALEPNDTEAFRRQAMAALFLSVPGIAPIHGIGLVRPRTAGQMADSAWQRDGGQLAEEQYCEDEVPPLIAMIETRPSGARSHEGMPLPLPVPTAIRLALGVAHVLAVVHALGFGIGGIRPQSIYVTGQPEHARVTGIAPRAERFWQMLPRPDLGILPGYLDSYDPPEHLRAAHNLGPDSANVLPAADVFSLCATLAYWVTGAHPFAGDNLFDQMSAILGSRRSIAPGIACKTLAALLDRGLAAEPAARPTITETVEVLRAAL